MRFGNDTCIAHVIPSYSAGGATVRCDGGRYGPIYAVNLGSVSAVVLNNMCTISDAFESKAHIFSDRPNWLPLICLIYQERGQPPR